MKKILIPLLFAALAGIMFYTVQGTGSQSEIQSQQYLEEIKQERRDKDNFMRLDEKSPLSSEQQEAFTGLKYFPADPDWRVEARLQENERKGALMLSTSDNKQQPYQKWGYAIFNKDGQEHRLLLLKAAYGPQDENLFLPFTDATSAGETYGAGRYLEVEPTAAQTITLDFNKAYNPYCAYSDGYSCPFPPEENMLNIAVTAGEKTFENYP